MAKTVFEEMFTTGKEPESIVKEKGLSQISDDSQIIALIDQVIAANPEPLANYLAGNERLLPFFVGQLMKLSKGSANPKKANELLIQELGKRKV